MQLICCIKPNKQSLNRTFDPCYVLSQLLYCGTTNFLELLRSGYPSRVNFSDLYDKYKPFLSQELVCEDPKVFCTALLQSTGCKSEFKVGKSKVFFRSGKIALLDRLMKSDEKNMCMVTEIYRKSIIRLKWNTVTSCIVCFLQCMFLSIR